MDLYYDKRLCGHVHSTQLKPSTDFALLHILAPPLTILTIHTYIQKNSQIFSH